MHELLIASRDLNDQNSEIEYQLAHAENLLGRIFESAEAAKRAMALTPDSVRKAKIAQEFAPVFQANEFEEEDAYFEEDVYN